MRGLCADGNLTGPLSLLSFLLLLSLSASLFPFDLLLVPFALICGVYGMPLLIPLVAYVESWKLAATILISTSVGRQSQRPQPLQASERAEWVGEVERLTERHLLLRCTCAVPLWPV